MLEILFCDTLEKEDITVVGNRNAWGVIGRGEQHWKKLRGTQRRSSHDADGIIRKAETEGRKNVRALLETYCLFPAFQNGV